MSHEAIATGATAPETCPDCYGSGIERHDQGLGEKCSTCDGGQASAPTAIEPQRVAVLTEDEQHLIVDVLRGDFSSVVWFDAKLADRLARRLAHGDEYATPADELARITLRKRRLEEEVRRINRRIADVEQQVIEDLAQIGARSMKHDDTGCTLRRDDKIWVKYADETADTEQRAEIKAQAGAIMQTLPELADFVRPDYNGQTVSAYFRELYRNEVALQADKPEHERRPIDPDALMPEPLRDLLRIDATPHITVRAG